MVEIKRISVLELVKSPAPAYFIELGCWNLAGIGRWDYVVKDLVTDDLVFYRRDNEAN